MKIVRDYMQRTIWMLRYQDCRFVAIYNTSNGLFIDPESKLPNSYYSTPWRWLPHSLCKERRLLRFGLDVISFQSNGHVADVAHLLVGDAWGNRKPMDLFLPPKCILYIAVRGSKIRGHRIQYQPLPISLMMKVYRHSIS